MILFSQIASVLAIAFIGTISVKINKPKIQLKTLVMVSFLTRFPLRRTVTVKSGLKGLRMQFISFCTLSKRLMPTILQFLAATISIKWMSAK